MASIFLYTQQVQLLNREKIVLVEEGNCMYIK